jgi:NodT family efflux transporter outer membrane factor (OMF) lipoprotein
MASRQRALAGLTAAAILAGCAAPAYKVPQVATALPPTYKETGPWTPAAPADAAPRGDWWTTFGDERLNALQAQLEAGNPDLAQALARYDQARAFYAQARADLFPQIGSSAEVGRQQESGGRLGANGRPLRGDDAVVGVAASYELDLWGRVRNEVAAGKAEAVASHDDVAATRLSLQAQLADAYLTLRSLDDQARVLDEAVESFQKALQLTQLRHEGGASSGLDVGQAQTQLRTAEAARTEVGAQRALAEHAIASLVGTPATTFAIAVDASLPPLPATPVSAPSVLLQRRPDVAAAERRAFAANRRIGVARSAFFPTVSLAASGGYQTSSWAQTLLSSPNSFWTLGPQLALTLFDGGRRRAGVKAADAQFDEASAAYKGVVLAAFQEVEDNLALLNRIAEETRQEQAALDAARHTLEISLSLYRQGAGTYLDVVTSQSAALDAERAVIQLQTRRLQASVDLVRALGGGWEVGAPAPTPATT